MSAQAEDGGWPLKTSTKKINADYNYALAA